MRTPSLRVRLVAAGAAAVVVVLACLDVFLYFSVRTSVNENLEAVLTARAELVHAEASRLEREALVARLTQLGIRATLMSPDGRVYRSLPPSPHLGDGLAPAADEELDDLASRTVPLPRGGTAEVYASTSGVRDALGELAVLEVVGTVLATGMAVVLLALASKVVLRPLAQVVAAAGRTAAGQRGQQLRPDRPNTELGRMAVAYDRMVESLEKALAQAQAAEAHSRRLEARSRQIIDTAQDAFVSIGADGVITDWNTQAERTFGWGRDEAMGRKLVEMVVPMELRQAHLEGVQRFLATGQTTILGRRVELSALHRDGHVFPVELTVWATSDGEGYSFNAFIQDITIRNQHEEAVRRLAAIIQWSDDAIIGATPDGIILTWNRAAELLYGYGASEVVGRHLSVLMPADRHGEMDGFLARIRRGERVPQQETVCAAKNGARLEVAFTLSPIRDSEGMVVGVSALARDIAEQRWMASTLNTTLAQLQVALEAAQQSEARSRHFLADAAHQLRTPIAGIRACAETLLRQPPPMQRDRLLADMVHETSRAGRLLASLLRVARLDQGEPLSPAPCDVAALCHDEADRARSLAPHLDISVQAGHVAQLPELDTNAVREMLANLLDNARRHASGRIEILLEVGEEWLELRVNDDGRGVPDSMTERVFERFVSLDGKGGSGLGLPIARELARAHGGDLVYEGGFVMRLPVRASMVDELIGPTR